MALPFGSMGAIALFAGKQSNSPRDWAFCNGQELQIAQNSALYSILGCDYGGNYMNTFGLPTLENIGGCRHLICTSGQFSFDKSLPFIEASEDENERFTGIITKTDGNVPNGWMPCDGRFLKLAEQENQRIYGLIGFTFGEDRSGGAENPQFALPNLNALGTQKYIICIGERYPSFG